MISMIWKRALNAEPRWQTSEQYVVINGIKSCREVEKTNTRYFLWAYSINEMIMNVEQSSFVVINFILGHIVIIAILSGMCRIYKYYNSKAMVRTTAESTGSSF